MQRTTVSRSFFSVNCSLRLKLQSQTTKLTMKTYPSRNGQVSEGIKFRIASSRSVLSRCYQSVANCFLSLVDVIVSSESWGTAGVCLILQNRLNRLSSLSSEYNMDKDVWSSTFVLLHRLETMTRPVVVSCKRVSLISVTMFL